MLQIPMLWRFSLYGFLKNQRYFDPFLILAFLQMGLSFTSIGFLIAFREVMINVMEIPSGAMADTWGRKRSMLLSMGAYIASFAFFGSAGLVLLHRSPSQVIIVLTLLPAMLLFAVGDAFRTGTHKSMIFTWLRLNDRINERTKIYGFTRSWSKLGSAFSVVLAGVFVFFSRNYILIFFFSIIPYLLNMVNLGSYPKLLEGATKSKLEFGTLFRHLKKVLIHSFKGKSLRRLITESMGFEGHFTATKDYLQPILKNATLPIAAGIFAGAQLTEEQSSVMLIIPVFFVLYLLSAFASRKAHLLTKWLGSDDSSAKVLWGATLFIYAAMIPALFFGIYPVMIGGFVLLYMIQNVWRPVLISRFDNHSEEDSGATVLSIESQAKSLASAILAPILGFAVDSALKAGVGQSGFWPIAVSGTLVALGFVLSGSNRGDGETHSAESTNH